MSMPLELEMVTSQWFPVPELWTLSLRLYQSHTSHSLLPDSDPVETLGQIHSWEIQTPMVTVTWSPAEMSLVSTHSGLLFSTLHPSVLHLWSVRHYGLMVLPAFPTSLPVFHNKTQHILMPFWHLFLREPRLIQYIFKNMSMDLSHLSKKYLSMMQDWILLLSPFIYGSSNPQIMIFGDATFGQ